MFNVAVFVSGKGSNLKSVFDKVPKDKIRICAVISDKKDCGAVQFAAENGLKVFFVDTKNNNDVFNYSELAQALKKNQVDIIVLAGFLKKIPDAFVDQFENRIINIHPALLPKFGGKGMYGMNVHNAVFDSAARISGATIHFVNKVYDNGLIIAQRTVDISDAVSPEDIASRVLKIEHELLPFVIEKFADNKIFIKDENVVIE